jgi:hypothetical protein
MIERPFVAAVGDQIAGRDKQRAGIGHHTSFRGAAKAASPESITTAGEVLQRPGLWIPDSGYAASAMTMYVPCVLKTFWR